MTAPHGYRPPSPARFYTGIKWTLIAIMTALAAFVVITVALTARPPASAPGTSVIPAAPAPTAVRFTGPLPTYRPGQ